jgi:hypothetical protein
MTLNIVSIYSIQVGQCIYIAIDKDPIKVTYVDIGRVEGIGCNSMGYVFIKRYYPFVYVAKKSIWERLGFSC